MPPLSDYLLVALAGWLGLFLMLLVVWQFAAQSDTAFPFVRHRQHELGSWYTIIPFESAPQQQLSAVVVSLEGALFVRPIPQKPAN
jgi:hypothetical protein